MPIKSKSIFTKEEELLLKDFSRNVSAKSSVFFYGNALIVSAIPIWLFLRIHMIDFYSSILAIVVVTFLSTYLVAFAYKNTKFMLKHKIAYYYHYNIQNAVKREGTITGNFSHKLLEDKKMSKKDKDERMLWKKNEVADYEATTFSIFYNNALFLALVIFISFFLLKTFSPSMNYIFSLGIAGSVLALLSTGTL